MSLLEDDFSIADWLIWYLPQQENLILVCLCMPEVFCSFSLVITLRTSFRDVSLTIGILPWTNSANCDLPVLEDCVIWILGACFFISIDLACAPWWLNFIYREFMSIYWHLHSRVVWSLQGSSSVRISILSSYLPDARSDIPFVNKFFCQEHVGRSSS